MIYLILIIVIGTSIWAAVDASKLQAQNYVGYNGAIATLIGCLLLWIICFPYYLIKRNALVKGIATLKSKNTRT